MHKLAIFLTLGVAAAQDAPNALSAQEKNSGWILLFDGKSLNGWEARPTSQPNTKGDWTVASGAMLCGGSVPSWIHTNDSFGDYQLKLEFRGDQTVNSGVFLRSNKEGQPHVTGYELQIWDTQPAGFNTGSLVGSLKAQPATLRGGQWNQYDITAKGNHFTIVLNGQKVLDASDTKHTAGVVGFQCQPKQRIEFRSVKIKPIK